MVQVFGIDLGTSSCSVASVIDGRTQVLPVFDGQYEMPTCVAFTPDGQRLVGWPAKRQSVTNPDNTIFAIKRLIGRKFLSAATQEELGLLPYRVIPSATGGLWVEAGGRSYTPTEITAIMLGEVKRATEAFLGSQLSEAVITVPAYFDEGQRRATKNAAEIVGIVVLRLIAEPTASAIAFGFGTGRSGTVAVYDLGGGTFDISILDIGDGVFEVKAVSGDNRLGGEDFDHRLVRYFVDQLQHTHGLNLAEDPLALYRIKDTVEQLKIQLDVAQDTATRLPYLSTIDGTFFHAELRLTRNLLEDLFSELIERTLNPCRTALKDAGFKPAELDALLLVGGMSRTPSLRKKVSEFFNLIPEGYGDPTRVVALGAAIQAGVLSKEIRDVLLLDVIPMSLGFADERGRFIPIISKNTTIPTKKSLIISREIDRTIERELKRREREAVSFLQGDAEALIKQQSIKIFQGEDSDIGGNLLLGQLPTQFTAEYPNNPVSVEVTFDINVNGTLQVSIKDRKKGEKFDQRIEALDPFARGTPTRYAEEDLAAARDQGDELLNLVDAAIKAYGATIRPDVLERIEKNREELKRAMQSRDAAELVGALAVLSATTDVKPSPKTLITVPPAIAIKATASNRSIFISYARPDRDWVDRLRIHLKPFERQGKLDVWHDGKIESGAPWKLEIDRALANASAAILLVSSHFMASTFIYENELPPILKRNASAQLAIFPIFIGHCFYEHDPVLSRLNAFNDPRRPLSAMQAAEVEAEFARFTGLLWERLRL
jgi:molecular chaperone DnaK